MSLTVPPASALVPAPSVIVGEVRALADYTPNLGAGTLAIPFCLSFKRGLFDPSTSV